MHCSTASSIPGLSPPGARSHPPPQLPEVPPDITRRVWDKVTPGCSLGEHLLGLTGRKGPPLRRHACRAHAQGHVRPPSPARGAVCPRSQPAGGTQSDLRGWWRETRASSVGTRPSPTTPDASWRCPSWGSARIPFSTLGIKNALAPCNRNGPALSRALFPSSGTRTNVPAGHHSVVNVLVTKCLELGGPCG